VAKKRAEAELDQRVTFSCESGGKGIRGHVALEVAVDQGKGLSDGLRGNSLDPHLTQERGGKSIPSREQPGG